jgi:nitronate monooxygenase
MINTPFASMFGLRMPVIMAPMFLVSNQKMMEAGIKSGIMATFPTLNYRKEGELEGIIKNLHAYKDSNNYKGIKRT